MIYLYWAIGLLFLLFVCTLLIPADSSVTRTADFDATIDEVWDVYTDFSSQPQWRDEVAAVRMAEDGQSWVETLKVGNIEIELSILEVSPPRRLVLKTASPKSFEGRYTAEFIGSDGRTTGTFTEEARSQGYFPKIIRFLFVNQDKIIQKYTEDAKKEILRRRTARSD